MRTLLKRRLRSVVEGADTKGDQWITKLIGDVDAGAVPMLDVLRWLEGASPPEKKQVTQSGPVILEYGDDDPENPAPPPPSGPAAGAGGDGPV